MGFAQHTRAHHLNRATPHIMQSMSSGPCACGAQASKVLPIHIQNSPHTLLTSLPSLLKAHGRLPRAAYSSRRLEATCRRQPKSTQQAASAPRHGSACRASVDSKAHRFKVARLELCSAGELTPLPFWSVDLGQRDSHMSGLPGILQACLFTSVLATHHPVAAYSHPSFCRALPSPCLRQSPGSAVERSSRAHVAPRGELSSFLYIWMHVGHEYLTFPGGWPVFCLKEAHSRRVKGPRQTPFLAKTNHPTAWTDDAAFAGFLEASKQQQSGCSRQVLTPFAVTFSQCNDPDVAAQLQVGQRSRMGARMLDHLQGVSKVDGSNGALRAIAHELAADEAIDSKEFFEAVEFYLRVRKVSHTLLTSWVSSAPRISNALSMVPADQTANNSRPGLWARPLWPSVCQPRAVCGKGPFHPFHVLLTACPAT